MKKIPESIPYCWLVIANSLFIVNAANVMLMRSRKATMYRTKMKGMILIRTFRIVFVPIKIDDLAGPLSVLISVREFDKTVPKRCDRLQGATGLWELYASQRYRSSRSRTCGFAFL